MKNIIKLTEKKLNEIISSVIVSELANTNGSFGLLSELTAGGEGGGMSTKDIMDLQGALKQTEFGNLLGASGPKKDGVDGIMGPRTKEALKQFQEKNAINDEMGFVGVKTLTALKPFLDKLPKQAVSPNQINAKPNKTPQGKNYLYFDGKTLKFVQNGRVVKTYNAFSGRTKWNALTDYQRKLAATMSKIEFMKVKSQGPIPEGTYYLGPIQTRTNGNSLTFCGNKDWVQLSKIFTDEFKKIGDKHDFNMGTAQDLIAWGNYRMPIKAKPGTNTFGRGSFYLHGGGIAGSIGCVDLVDKIDDFVAAYKNYLTSTGAKTIDLIVDYSGRMKTPNQPMIAKTPENIGEPASAKMDRILFNPNAG